MNRREFTVVAAMGLASTALLALNEEANADPKQRDRRRERHPHIRAAITELEAAKMELKNAAHDFGGHRVAAMAAVNESIKQLRICMEHDR